jgi:two-component system phosphate regulon response regulator OmpR
MRPQILIIDDDAEVRDELGGYLRGNGMDVSVLHDGSRVAKRIALERPSLIIVDAMLPVVDGLTVLRDLRAAGDDIPIILTSEHDDVSDRVIGLELGADDYLCKPLDSREVYVRIKRIFDRRTQRIASAPEDRPPFRFGPFEVDFVNRALRRDGERISLREREFAILKVFVNNPMKTLSRAFLHDQLGGGHATFRDRSLDVPIWRLRQLLEIDPSEPRFIQTVWGAGYVFVPSGVANGLLATACAA